MKKRLISLVLTVVMLLSLSIPTFAADEPTYGEYDRESSSVVVVSTEVTAGEEYMMIAINNAKGELVVSGSGAFTADANGNLTYTMENVGTIPDRDHPENTDLTGWEIIIRDMYGIVARGPLTGGTGVDTPDKVAVTGVSLDKTTATIKVGETVTLSETVAPEDATNKNVSWSSSDTSIATVENGVVTGVAAGEAVITVTTEDGGKTAACTVTVTASDTPSGIPVTGVDLDRHTLPLYVGENWTLNAKVTPEDADDQTVTWSSSDTSVVTVTSDGVVTAVGTGSATITATAGACSDTCDVTVTVYTTPSYNPGTQRPSSSRPSSSNSSSSSNTNTNTRPADTDSNPADTTPDDTANNTPSNSVSFTDVAQGAFYYDAVQWAVAQGITTGMGENTFAPDSPCTRAQIVTFLWRAAGSPASTGTNQFTDVAADAYYADAVNWAVAQGITTGMGENMFMPNETCTRAQAVTFLYRYAGSPAVSSSSAFADVAAGAYYADAVNWAVGQGITNGTSATTFAPNDICTRGHIVTFLYRDLAN